MSLPKGVLLLLALPAAGHAQTCPDPSALTRGLDPVTAVVRYLADDALEGRLAGSPAERCAGDFIAGRFQALGLEPGGTDGYFDTVRLATVLDPHGAHGTGRNVIGVLPGADPALRDEIVVIGAHYDHLGRGEFGSMAPEPGDIHNGADDNASGVAGLLRAAATLSSGPRPARTVVFVAFTGEEMGLLGSASFVGGGRYPAGRMRAMLNMDMVGRLGDDRSLIVNGVDTATEWRELLARAGADAGVEYAFGGRGDGPSDHTSFYGRNVPVLHFFTNVHGDYHRPTDDWTAIDAAGVETVAGIVARVAAEVAGRTATITFVPGQSAPATQNRAGGSGTYLGSIPDFTPVERGVLLSGVGPGSPAEKAGLLAGDIILRLGAHEVADLQALTDALRAHEPGDVVEVAVKRAGRDLVLRVELGDRANR